MKLTWEKGHGNYGIHRGIPDLDRDVLNESMKDKADTTALRRCTKSFNKWKMLVNKCKIKVFG